MSKIWLESMKTLPTFKKKFEIVERKGIGHPDTICDNVMNQISSELCKMYLEETGAIQHHNMDKALLVAGQSENKFGGGKITKPMRFVLGDRATFEVDGKKLPVEEISVNTAKKWFDDNLRFVKEEHVTYQLEIGTSSQELRSIFKNPKQFLSNDTSVLVGYAPLTPTETSVLETEHFINSKDFKREFPESGEDVKVMGFRNNSSLDLTIAMAFVDSEVSSEDQYFNRKKEMRQTISEFLKNKENFENLDISINNLDAKGKGIEGVYLTVLGTSADGADSGEVGRGNMAHGLISPTRPAGTEATAGKNPVSHIGKIYNVLSFILANEIHNEIPDFEEVLVWMYNVIGKPVADPKAIVVNPISEKSLDVSKYESQIKEVIEKKLSKIDEFCMDLALGKFGFI